MHCISHATWIKVHNEQQCRKSKFGQCANLYDFVSRLVNWKKAALAFAVRGTYIVWLNFHLCVHYVFAPTFIRLNAIFAPLHTLLLLFFSSILFSLINVAVVIVTVVVVVVVAIAYTQSKYTRVVSLNLSPDRKWKRDHKKRPSALPTAMLIRGV